MELCLLKDWVGDGICDDTTNTKKCNYDGNDCCEGTYGLCYKCLCHLTKETNRIETEYFPNCTIFTIGDGRCDWWNYNELCGFDGGDCATTTTTTLAPEGAKNSIWRKTCEIHLNDFFKGCMKPLWVGDGFCDDETNDEDCNYDGGDCCTENPNVDYCNDCECKWINGKNIFFFICFRFSILSRTVVVVFVFFLKNTWNLSRKYDESVFINAKTCRCHTCSLVIFGEGGNNVCFHSRNRKWFFKACLLDDNYDQLINKMLRSRQKIGGIFYY